MLYDDLVAYFRTPSGAARALGVDRRLVNDWKKRRIPTKHQLLAQKRSAGQLEPDEQAKREAEELATILNPEVKVA